MTNDKAVRVLRTVLKRTEEGKIPWEATEDEDVFEASYETETLRVGEENGEDSMGDPYVVYYLEILNKQGRTIGKTYAGEIENFPGSRKEMRKIFHMARDKALGVDEAVSSLLKRLDEYVEDSLDDEIPF